MAFHVRHLILILCVMSSAVVYITRININIAIVAMVEPITQSINSTKGASPSDAASSINRLVREQTCPIVNKTTTTTTTTDPHHLHASVDKISDNPSTPTTTVASPERYKWDQGLQGLILGSFYYTYILFQIPTGLLAERFGGRVLISLSLIGSCVINAITPVIASYPSVMIASRILLGTFQAGIYPGAFAMCNTWLKLKERAFAFAMTEAGACVGTIFTYFSSGFISQSLGWPWVFYVSGLMAFISFVIFIVLASDDPHKHPCIGRNELIDRSEEVVVINKSTPWLAILTCPAVLSAALFKFSLGWTYTTLGSKLPAYLNDIMHEDISSNGVINGTMNLIFTLSMAIGGLASERIIQRKLASRTSTRKLYSIVSGFGSAFCILLIPLAGCNRMALLTILYVGSFCLGSASGSDVPLASEMSNNFPATLYSLLNMVAMSSGFITPSFVGFLLEGSSDLRSSWARVFYFSSFLTAIATVIFILFASAERQKFDLQIDTLEAAREESTVVQGGQQGQVNQQSQGSSQQRVTE